MADSYRRNHHLQRKTIFLAFLFLFSIFLSLLQFQFTSTTNTATATGTTTTTTSTTRQNEIYSFFGVGVGITTETGITSSRWWTLPNVGYFRFPKKSFDNNNESNEASIIHRRMEEINTNVNTLTNANANAKTNTAQENEEKEIEMTIEGFDNNNSDDEGDGIPLYAKIFMISVLITLSGFFSGLTLGLLSLDKTGLEIVMSGDNPKHADAAKLIFSIRKNGNLLLCTLLLGNTMVNSLLSILMAQITSGTVGFVASTAVIVLFGEILPQAVCSRYALEVGSRAVPMVRVMMALLYVLSAPIAFGLDKLLGREIGTTYSKSEMLKLLQIQMDKGKFDEETGNAMTGALKYKDVLIKNVMTPTEKLFMLNAEEKLSFHCMAKIFKSGYSRIPVYEISKNNVIGLLFVKDLIFIDPEDETLVRTMVQIFGRGVHVVWPNDDLGSTLRKLKQGRSHMALVRDVNNEEDTQDPFYEIKGIITLEDIIEEIIGDEIVDETDEFLDNHDNAIKVERKNIDWAKLRMLDSKITDEMLSKDEIKAITAHLRMNHAEVVQFISDYQLYQLVKGTSVSNLPMADFEFVNINVVNVNNISNKSITSSISSGAGGGGGNTEIPRDLMYEKGVPTNVCTLILSGKVTVLAGQDDFRSDVSSWSILAISSLTDPLYSPDFTAYVSVGPCKCIQISRDRFQLAVDATAMETINMNKLIKQKPKENNAISNNHNNNNSSNNNNSNNNATLTSSLPPSSSSSSLRLSSSGKSMSMVRASSVNNISELKKKAGKAEEEKESNFTEASDELLEESKFDAIQQKTKGDALKRIIGSDIKGIPRSSRGHLISSFRSKLSPIGEKEKNSPNKNHKAKDKDKDRETSTTTHSPNKETTNLKTKTNISTSTSTSTSAVDKSVLTDGLLIDGTDRNEISVSKNSTMKETKMSPLQRALSGDGSYLPRPSSVDHNSNHVIISSNHEELYAAHASTHTSHGHGHGQQRSLDISGRSSDLDQHAGAEGHRLRQNSISDSDFIEVLRTPVSGIY